MATAMKTGPGKIAFHRWATMFDSNDMVDFMGEEDIIFVKQAVFTPPLSSSANEIAQPFGDGQGHQDAFFVRALALISRINISA
jgi:hypothetical protein